MRRAWLVAPLLLLLAGCASVPGWPFVRRSPALLERADRLAGQGDYEAAVAGYDAFLAEHGDDAAAPRARMSRETAAAVVATRAEVARLRQELAKREADLARVRDDLERLKQIDLRLERRGQR